MENKKKHIAILGSTGSIGTQALDVIKRHPNKFQVEVLTAANNWQLLVQQAQEFEPNAVVISNESYYNQVSDALSHLDVKVYAGNNALASVVEMETIDIVLTALVGYAGLLPTLRAIDSGKTIALANKETLVVAGDLVTRRAREKGVNLLPVDSEHSAIFQCLVGEFHNPIEKIVLTASGGPFRGKSRPDLEKVTKAQALKHPNWDMGAKITIDSASLMNKGLEVIEAKWLFGLSAGQIEVIVHPQSIIHSLVQFKDGSMKAQMGLPDMRVPIQFALSYPDRLAADFPRFNFLDYPNLAFEPADMENFPNLGLAFEAMHRAGNSACVLNAANEIAVAEFLQEKIRFLDMPKVVSACLNKVDFIEKPTLDDYIATDKEARRLAGEFSKQLANGFSIGIA